MEKTIVVCFAFNHPYGCGMYAHLVERFKDACEQVIFGGEAAFWTWLEWRSRNRSEMIDNMLIHEAAYQWMKFGQIPDLQRLSIIE